MLTKPPVPYAFAKVNGIAVTGLGDGVAEVVVRHGASAGALAELRRALGVPIRAQRVGAGEFDERISTLYNGADEGAAALADDLAQDLERFLKGERPSVVPPSWWQRFRGWVRNKLGR